MAEVKSNLFKFNVKNLKYSFATGGVYQTPEPLAYGNSVSLEETFNEQILYGDGEALAVLPSDKGKKGTLGVTVVEKHYEEACGRMMEINNSIFADVQQRYSKQHAIYYEVDALLDGVHVTIKNWLFGCITGRASESYEQSAESPKVNNYEYPLTVLGVTLLDSAGTAEYKDANGNTYKVYRMTAYPTDTGYATFGDAVPTVKAKAA